MSVKTISPRISEKAYGLSLKNIYIFDVPMSANKSIVKAAILAENKDIVISDVRLLVAKGKVKASSRGKHARPAQAARQDKKKAYVTVKSGKIVIPEFKVDEPKEAKKAEVKATKKVVENAEAKSATKVAKRRTGNRGDK